jgi:protein TonB
VVARIASSPSFPPYGAAELRRLARPYLARATLAGSVLWIGLFLLLKATSGLWLGAPPAPPVVREPGTHVLIPPPLVEPVSTVRVGSLSATPAKGPASYVPVERPDAPPELPPAQGSTGGRIGEGPGTPPGEQAGGQDGSPPENIPPPDRWFYVEQLPVPVLEPQPDYPPLARDVGEEGLVVVRVLVGTDGRVRDAFVEPGHSILILDAEALKAAKRWVFQPALSSGHPVMVWVSIPFRFTLHR